MNKQKLYKAVIQKYGVINQIEMMVEECSELIQAIQKAKRSNTIENNNHICEEIADVEIMIEQMRGIYSSDEIDKCKTFKLERLEKRLSSGCLL